MSLLAIRNLAVEFITDGRSVKAVEDVTLSIEAGQTLALVGESGCGKSITALAIARLFPSPPGQITAGEILLNDRDLRTMPLDQLRKVRGREIAYVFQEPGASLNPVMRVGHQIKEALRLHRPDCATDEEVVRLLRVVGIPAPEMRHRDFPHELSGGMQQRVMIAMALAAHPNLLVADEPTTALDVTIQAQIMELLARLQQELNMSILLITHNLNLVRDLAHQIAVMYAGQIVECGNASAVLRQPYHPYTQALIRSIPHLGKTGGRLRAIPGQVPPLGAMPAGCRFHPRCAQIQLQCSRQVPALTEIAPGRWVRCPFWSANPANDP